MTTDDELVDALRAGDERAFVGLVDHYSPAMLSVARSHVANREVAQDVVQDTWLALPKGIDGFEGRASLRTWLFRVLVNIAKTRGVREKRSTPVDLAATGSGPTVSANRYQSVGDRWPGHWVRFPERWTESPERSALSGEGLDLVRRELARLPEQQRLVVSMRDVDGYDSVEVCALLELSAAKPAGAAAPRPRPHQGSARRLLRGGVVSRWDGVDFGGIDCRKFVERGQLLAAFRTWRSGRSGGSGSD